MIIDELRSATKQAHQQLDHALYPHIQGIQTTNDYARLLHIFYGMFQPIYQQLDEFLTDSLVPGYSLRRKPEWILHDLETIGADSGTIEWCNDIPSITHIPAAFGCFYVLEGSTMGGNIISKKIRENLQWDSGEGTRFFSGYGENNKAMWSNFLTAMEQVPENNLYPDQLIEAAQDTFVKFHHWINKHYDRNQTR